MRESWEILIRKVLEKKVLPDKNYQLRDRVSYLKDRHLPCRRGGKKTYIEHTIKLCKQLKEMNEYNEISMGEVFKK